MDEWRKEVAVAFMDKAKEKTGSRDGLGRIPGISEGMFYAMGLVQCFVAFEAFCSWKFGVRDAKSNQERFCQEYIVFTKGLTKGFTTEIGTLFKELQEKPLKDMGNPNKRTLQIDKLEIENHEDLFRIFRVMYRVRGNIIHGGKEMKENRNINLMKNSFNLLYKILDNVLRKEGIL